jgi:hypothetical protein
MMGGGTTAPEARSWWHEREGSSTRVPGMAVGRELIGAAHPRGGGINALGGGVSSAAWASRWPVATCGRPYNTGEEE